MTTVVPIGMVPYAKLEVADPIAVGTEAPGLTWFGPAVKVRALFGLPFGRCQEILLKVVRPL